eukprot:gene656-811_t
MIDIDIPPSLMFLMMLRNQSFHENNNRKKNNRDSDISDSSGDEEYRSLIKCVANLTEELTCSICFEFYDKPLILPCSHSFCKKCIEQVAGNKTVLTCPLCRTQLKLSERGIDDIPVNNTISNIVETLRDTNQNCPKICDHCHSRKVSRKCEQCDVFLCRGCSEQLHSQKNTHHTIVHVDGQTLGDFNVEFHNDKDNEIDPPVYIPYKISKSDSLNLFFNWISSLWFAPSDLRSKLSIRYVKPIYLPYWIFEAHTTTKYGASICLNPGPINSSQPNQLYSYTSKFERKTNLYSNRYRYASIANIKLIDKELLPQVQSWELSNIPSIDDSNPNQKIQALAFMMDESTAWKKNAESKIYSRDKEVCETRIKTSCGLNGLAKDIFVNTTISKIASQKVFLPVYFIKYIYDSKSYTVIINAQSSKIVGNRPYNQGLSTMFRMFKPNYS